MNELYGQTCSCCHHANPRNEASVSASFTPELMARLLADIFARKFNVEDEIYPELYEAARDTFERALEEGYPIEDVDDADTLFRQALKDDADVFAAFRTHRMQNDIASQLLDENGKLKEFRRFQEDAESVIGTYNNHWLRTEYDTAVLRARYAADWKRFSRNADILPNLKWMPTTSADPDVFHMEYWRIGLTLPKTHPFWKTTIRTTGGDASVIWRRRTTPSRESSLRWTTSLRPDWRTTRDWSRNCSAIPIRITRRRIRGRRKR